MEAICFSRKVTFLETLAVNEDEVYESMKAGGASVLLQRLAMCACSQEGMPLNNGNCDQFRLQENASLM